MKKNLIVYSIIGAALLGGAYYAGYATGERQGEAAAQETQGSLPALQSADSKQEPNAAEIADAIHSRWLKDELPPMAGVSIGGKPIKVDRGGYTWSVALPNGEVKSSVADISAPQASEPAVAPGGSKIETAAPKGIKGLTLINMDDPASEDAYIVPMAKGTYLYQIQCSWPLDQGHADYYFAVKVL